MDTRRQFLKKINNTVAFIGIIYMSFVSGIRWACGKTQKIILLKGTKREALIQENPADLDARPVNPRARLNPNSWNCTYFGNTNSGANSGDAILINHMHITHKPAGKTIPSYAKDIFNETNSSMLCIGVK